MGIAAWRLGADLRRGGSGGLSADLLEHLSTQYDIVLIDTPPLLPVTDAAILTKITGGALVVAAAGMVHRQQLADALGTLRDVGARVLGVVLNRVTHTPAELTFPPKTGTYGRVSCSG